MSKTRLELTDGLLEMVMKMSDGNPGAAMALMELFKKAGNIDPDSALCGLGPLLQLDTLGIYGTDIYVLFSDICGKDIVSTVAVLRSTQLGFFSRGILKDACSRQDYSGRDMVPVKELVAKVCEKLPNFNKKGE